MTGQGFDDRGQRASEGHAESSTMPAGKRTRTMSMPGPASTVQRKATAEIPAPATPAGAGSAVDDPFGMHLLEGPVRDGPTDGAAEMTARPSPATAEASAAAAEPAPAAEQTVAPASADKGAGASAPPSGQAGPEPGRSGSPGDVRDAPSATYLVPFDRSPLAAPGERIICVAEFTGGANADYEIVYTCVNGHFTTAAGPATVTVQGLMSGNVNFFVPTPWNGTEAVSVTMKLRKKADSSIVQTETWTFGKKAYYPTTMTQREGTGEIALPGNYTYDIGPARPGATAPFYQHQTILEWFDSWSIPNIAPADIDPTYRAANGLTSTATITAHTIGAYAGSNGTFTVNANDRVGDTHGGHPNVEALAAKLVTPKDIEVALPQTYEAQPGTALARFTVTRIRKTDGTWKVKKAPR